ncbi:hypothetical protein BC941DRAFT_415769 [Chlamydoabsidia padenii]|nr:hypothetical protein BC941DRAFT_415769 [Chlamydoabsidia padenii]
MDKNSMDPNNSTNSDDKFDNNTPYHQLQTHASHVFDRLKSTDIRSLNRRLKRAFDMVELSKMSNSIIDSILADIILFHDQFLWLKNNDNGLDGCNNTVSGRQQHQNSAALLLSAFFPTLTLLQNMLQEIGELRMTMNDLQLEYVKKVEEIQQLVEKDILRKRLESTPQSDQSTSDPKSGLKSSPPSSTLPGEKNNGALAWVYNILHIQPSSSSTKKGIVASSLPSATQQQSLQHQRSYDSISTTAGEAVTRGGTQSTSDLDPLATTSKQVSLTTSSSLRIKQKKNELDRFGPPSSFPRTTPLNEQKRRRRSGSKQYSNPLRPSVSAGPTRKGTATVSPGIWSPPPPPSSSPPSSLYATSHGVVDKPVQRKRSLLGLGSSSKPLDKIDSIDWKLGTSFGGSWLGT